MAPIVLEALGKRFPDGTLAVRDVDLDIADGELIVLVGPSGCGKSTVLNMIAGLEEITSGELRIDGRRMNEKKPRERDIAMVFQSYALYPHMTVRDNLAFPLRLARLDARAVERKVAEVARILELTPWLERKPAQLSGGQRQRVAMGRAIVRRPHAFLMDEPLSNLDARLRVQMRIQVAKLRRRLGATMVYVTHDQTEAMTLGDRVVVLRGGMVQQIGAPQDLYDRPANLFVAEFIGSPSMNVLDATVTEGRLRTRLGDFSIPERLKRRLAAAGMSRELVLGIRPEHVEEAARVGEGTQGRGAEFDVVVDLVESLGWEKYAYLALPGDDSPPAASHWRAAEEPLAYEPSSGSSLVVRLPASAGVRAGTRARFWLDLERIHLFDPTTGRRFDEGV